MKLMILFGPPAVGKMTVGNLLEAQTSYRLFHNHMIMDGVMQLFGVGTPAEDRLSRIIREKVIEEAADSGMDLIFTYVWNFGLEKGRRNIDAYKAIYEARGGEVHFVELAAPVETRIVRSEDPARRRLKAHAPLAQRIALLETTHDFHSPVPFFYPETYLRIDTKGKTPEEVAGEITSWEESMARGRA